MDRLKKRKDYLKVARGARTPRRGFLLQSSWREGAVPGLEAEASRFGFTVTKKTGNAVVRNRIRRRLKEAVRLEGQRHAAPGQDLVLIGRHAALDMPFADLMADVAGAIRAAGKRRNADGNGSHKAAAQNKEVPPAASSEEETRQ